jgi:hypothetical protein
VSTPTPRVRATDDADLARQLGFNRWDEDRAQYVLDEDYDGNDLDDEAATDEDESPETAPREVVDYTGWSYTDLQAEARKRSLDPTGKREDLAARLTTSDQAGE